MNTIKITSSSCLTNWNVPCIYL